MSKDVIECTVRSLQWIYTIVIALSIGEAFKQFVPVPDAYKENCRIHWDRLPSLLSLLVLIVPFYQGMAQWFSRIYCTDQILQPYGLWLLVDCTAFTVEAGLFFMLARSLPKSLWRRFTCMVVVLLCLDISWGVFAWEYRTSSISTWVIVNICTVPVLVGIFLIFRKRAPRFGMLASLIVLLLLLTRTLVDYWTGWKFYFPR